MYAPPVSSPKADRTVSCSFFTFSQILRSNFQSNYKGGNASSIGSGPQFYTKPPSALPSNQTIEFDDGPKITVFIGELDLLLQFQLLTNSGLVVMIPIRLQVTLAKKFPIT